MPASSWGALKGLRGQTEQVRVLRAVIVLLLVANVIALGTAGGDDRSGEKAGTSRRPAGVGVQGGPAGGSDASGADGSTGPGGGGAGGGSGGGAGGGSAGGGGGGGGVTGGSGVKLPGGGTGVTDDKILIGIQTYEGIQEVATTVFGANSNSNPEDEDDPEIPALRPQYDAVIAWINSHGGIGGREVVGVFHNTDALVGTFAEQEQAACVAFTEDAHVFAAISGEVIVRDVLPACTNAHDTPLLHMSVFPFDATAIAEFNPGMFYQPRKPLPERGRAAWIQGLVDLGFLTPESRIGLIRADAPIYDRIAAVTKDRLGEHGLGIVPGAEIKVTYGQSAADVGTNASQCGQGMLTLKTLNVDRVLFIDTEGSIPFVCFPQADQIGYHPRYGLSTDEFPVFQENSARPKTQLDGAVAIGWRPDRDIDANETTRNFDPASVPGRTTCLDIYAQAGINPGAMGPCDSLLFLKAAIERGGEVSVAGLLAGSDQLGGDYPSTSNFAATFGPNRYDGTAAVAYLAFEAECRCFKYVSGPRPMP